MVSVLGEIRHKAVFISKSQLNAEIDAGAKHKQSITLADSRFCIHVACRGAVSVQETDITPALQQPQAFLHLRRIGNGRFALDELVLPCNAFCGA